MLRVQILCSRTHECGYQTLACVEDDGSVEWDEDKRLFSPKPGTNIFGHVQGTPPKSCRHHPFSFLYT